MYVVCRGGRAVPVPDRAATPAAAAGGGAGGGARRPPADRGWRFSGICNGIFLMRNVKRNVSQ